MPKHRSFHLVSLGCPKNLVDSEGMVTLLRRAGFSPSEAPGQADLIIVNTCGFIERAREESLAALRKLGASKRAGQHLVAAGCYAQRSSKEIAELVPAVDGIIGTRSWMDIVQLVTGMDQHRPSMDPHQGPTHYRPGLAKESLGLHATPPDDLPRVALQGASAYLKLSDGCHRSCAFCAIPLIKGTSVSRPPEEILADADWLGGQGVQEISLIAQDTTSYGRDLGMRHGLSDLLESLVAAVPGVPWIRVMYAFPGAGLSRLADKMAAHRQILPYLDLPLQHAHPDILRRMRRPAEADEMRRIISDLRRTLPEIAIRTTFVVGFPGETEAEFGALLDFVGDMEFDRVGVFTYSHEKGTPAADLADDVPDETKEARRERLMGLQQPISLAKNGALVGTILDVLIEGQGDGMSVGRTYRDAPEIDGLVLVQAELPVGQIAPVRITAALEYDLVGELPGG